jgi:hypothetical protein
VRRCAALEGVDQILVQFTNEKLRHCFLRQRYQ